MKEHYKKQVNLLLEILDIALDDSRFALKGGTAINLFYRDMPRYSVDIDLCFLPIEDRRTTFNDIHAILSKIKNDLERKRKLKVNTSKPLDGREEVKMMVIKDDIEIIIEPNFVLRGSLFDTENKKLSVKAEEEFNKSLSVQCLSFADLYGGKLCAALDRQHPRDFFDIKFLFENEGITEEIKDSFLFYLISHNRPLNELLKPNKLNLESKFNQEFLDMAEIKIGLQELENIRDKLLRMIISVLKKQDKRFLISFVSGEPDWSLVFDEKIKNYPSVKWKILNQEKMGDAKRETYIKEVKRCLGEE